MQGNYKDKLLTVDVDTIGSFFGCVILLWVWVLLGEDEGETIFFQVIGEWVDE